MLELRHQGIEPILGLVHHGSGPGYTSLADPQFPEKLARYAGQVARRYPWVRDWTPVNEPLTTARFSGLYGFWYPHAETEADFLRILFNECRGVMLAMRAIRETLPDARLVQTEDLGRNFCTERMRRIPGMRASWPRACPRRSCDPCASSRRGRCCSASTTT
jgi:dTDP-4-dehydrorhamnose reductase